MLPLTTERLVLRNYRIEDLGPHHRLMSDKKTMYYLADLYCKTLEDSRANLVAAIVGSNENPRTRVFLAVENAATREYIGSAGYTVTESTPVGRVVHAGYFFLPEYHGKGYATEVLRELLRYAFEEDDVFRFNTGCFSGNAASERGMIKCGMIKEGDYPQSQWLDGRMRGRLAYRLLKSEWMATKKAGLMGTT